MVTTQTAPPALDRSRGPFACRAPATTQARSARPMAGGLPPAVVALDLPTRFMAIGLGALALLAIAYPWHLPLLQGSFYAPDPLTFVHVDTLGLIAAVTIGAGYQLGPIVLQTELASPRLARFPWWLYLPGVVLFVVGLGHGIPRALGVGGTLVFVVIGVHVLVIGRTLAGAPARGVTWWAFAVATAGLAGAGAGQPRKGGACTT